MASAMRKGKPKGGSFANTKGKYHEWIPVKNIDEIFKRAKNQTEFDKAIDVMNNARSKTKGLVFTKPPYVGYGHIGNGEKAGLEYGAQFHADLDEAFLDAWTYDGVFDKDDWIENVDIVLRKFFVGQSLKDYRKHVKKGAE